MNYLQILPRHNAIGLSADMDFAALQNHNQSQIFPQPKQDASITLKTAYESEAAALQYVLLTPDGEPLPAIMRAKEASLSVLAESGIRVSMRWVILDWDLPSKGIPWGSPEKPESQKTIHEFIQAHPKLRLCYAYYFSKSGLRVIFELANPLEIASSEDVLVWKHFYKAFLSAIDVSEIGGDLELKSNPFTLNRVPNYTDAQSNRHHLPRTAVKIEVKYRL